MSAGEKPPPSSSVTHIVDVDPVATRRHGIFTVASGIDAGKILVVPQGEIMMLGRSAECTHPFDDASLSRVHARVMAVGAEYIIRDDGSRNGTFVNNARISKAETLRNGDRVQLGSNTLLRFALVDDEEERALRRVYEAAILDGLTGVFNRKHLEARIAAELAYAERHQSSLSVVIIDIVDHFKKVNDTYGHLGGDAVLRAVASTFASGLRAEDVLARYGGEEFVILVRGGAQQALDLADRLRSAIEAASIPFESHTIRVTSSAGVASLDEEGLTPDREALLGAADARLYQAKTSGRNRVVGP